MTARTKIIPFTELKPGDRILVSFGTCTVLAVTIEGNRAWIDLQDQGRIGYHVHNWPMIVLPAEVQS